MIIGITGTLAAGKGTIVEFLLKKGFEHYSVRKFLIEEINRRNLPVNRDSMVFIANDLREKYSPSYIVEQLYLSAKDSKKNCVIESIRAPGEVLALKSNPDFYLFSVDANPLLRYNRAVLRQSETDKISFSKFLDDEKREMHNTNPAKQNLQKCIELADYKFFNNGTIDDLFLNVESVINKLM